jgi:hypothetical protein
MNTKFLFYIRTRHEQCGTTRANLRKTRRFRVSGEGGLSPVYTRGAGASHARLSASMRNTRACILRPPGRLHVSSSMLMRFGRRPQHAVRCQRRCLVRARRPRRRRPRRHHSQAMRELHCSATAQSLPPSAPLAVASVLAVFAGSVRRKQSFPRGRDNIPG